MTRLNLASGPNNLPGFVNLNPPNWKFEDGLHFADGEIEAISESHGLMYVAIKDWPYVFSEIARVLEPGGVVRITEDDTANPDSERYGGWHDAVTLTSPKLVASHLRKAKLRVVEVTQFESNFKDDSLRQAWHGSSPKCFWIEGRKPL